MPNMRLLYDSVNVRSIPPTATMVAGYLTGALIPTTIPALRTRFPQAQIVTIAVTAQQDAQVLDVERGDANPNDVPAWVRGQRAIGKDPTVYCSTSVWPAIKAACAAQNVPLPYWWEAHYDGIAQLSADPRAVAKQYSNGTYDTSVVATYWPGVDPVPPAAPPEDDMAPIYRVTDGPSVDLEFYYFGPIALHIDPATSAGLVAAGVKVAPISGDLFAKIQTTVQ